MVSYFAHGKRKMLNISVLILIVVDDGLVRVEHNVIQRKCIGLNPCCSGQWSRTTKLATQRSIQRCLNPCCSGRWSRTPEEIRMRVEGLVLILAVVEDGLVHYENFSG